MRNIFLLFCFSILSSLLFAQNNKAVLSGKLVDTSGKTPLAFATISIFKAKDTSIITYRLSDPAGNFKVTGLPLSIELRAVITSSGFSVYRKEFHFTSSQLNIDIGEIKMEPDIKTLDEILVFSERPPVSVKNDTIEFNASAFKTLPSALVEDLLKKLPGVDVDLDGNITVNNRRVNRILVDGKEFFGGDSKVATRNLPANLVDKVQVTDDKEELARNPETNKSELGQVINLKLKRSIKKGWFGKAYAGAGGNADRAHYESGAIINSFRDTFQVSALGYANNINRAGFGFDDLGEIGGFKRSGYSSASFGAGGDVSFGSTGQGIQKSAGAGININHDPKENLNLNFQYFFGQIITDYNSKVNAQQFIADTILNTLTSSKDRSENNTHRFASKITWEMDSFSTIIFRPGVTLRKSNSLRNSFSETSSNYDPKLNESNNKQRMVGDDVSYTHDLNYNHMFKKMGRSISFSSNLYYGDNDNDQYNLAGNIFYNSQIPVTILNQDRQKQTGNLRTSAVLSFNEPLSKTSSLRIFNTLNYFKDKDDLNTYEWNPLTGEYDLLNNDLSNGFERKGVKNTAAITLGISKKKMHFTPGLSLQSIHIKNDFLKDPMVVQKYFYVFPTFNFYFNNFNAGYNVFINEPSAYDLQPVVDNTNPLYQSYGNPDLVPSIVHILSAGFNKYDMKKLVSYNLYSNFNFTDHTIIRERTVDDKGVQTTRPLNVNGAWYGNLNFSISKQYKFKKDLRFSVRPSLSFNGTRSFVIVNSNKSEYLNFIISSSIMWTFNWKDLVEFNQRYNLNHQRGRYESDAFPDLSVISHVSTTELVIRLPKNWVWESTVDYRYNPQVAPGFSKNIFRWNAGINYLFLKEKKGQLRLYVFDILKQNTSAFRFVRENYIQDIESNTLTRFFLITFTYNIREFKGGKVGGRNSFFKF